MDLTFFFKLIIVLAALHFYFFHHQFCEDILNESCFFLQNVLSTVLRERHVYQKVIEIKNITIFVYNMIPVFLCACFFLTFPNFFHNKNSVFILINNFSFRAFIWKVIDFLVKWLKLYNLVEKIQKIGIYTKENLLKKV